MTKEMRKEMVVAMETVMRHLNDETIFESWLMCGVADGDVTREVIEDPQLLDDYYTEKEAYDELCKLFTRLVKRASKDSRPFY